MSIDEDRQRYLDAAHAVQTGIAYLQHTSPALFDSKHVRVGIDTAKVEHAGLATLLIRKGLFTEAEYFEAMADAMEEEQRRLEAELGLKLV
jgi:precorrin isomerase